MGTGLAEGFGSLFLLIFAAAFPIVNPAGSALIFLDMTRRAAHRTREGLARRVAFYSFLVLNVSLFIGSFSGRDLVSLRYHERRVGLSQDTVCQVKLVVVGQPYAGGDEC